MATLKIYPAQARAFITVRNLATDDAEGAKTLRKTLWASIRDQFDIPDSIKLKVEIDNANAPNYLVLTDKATNLQLHMHPATGKFSAPPPPAPVQRPRWFMVDEDDIRASVIDQQGFEDGDLDLDSATDGAVYTMASTGDVALDSEGAVFIKLGADDFSF